MTDPIEPEEKDQGEEGAHHDAPGTSTDRPPESELPPEDDRQTDFPADDGHPPTMETLAAAPVAEGDEPGEEEEGLDTLDVEATVNLTGDLDATVNLSGGQIPLRLPEEEREGAAGDVARGHLKGLIEALVFASDRPIKAGELAKSASAPSRQVKELLEELRQEYTSRGMQLDEVAGGWIFRTNAAYAPFVRDLTKQKPVKLTRAQIETLAILAYRQPITRPEIDEIRGVDCGPVLKLLLERDLIRILGKKDEPGRPLIYGTTTQFLEFFGLKSLRDLPTLREFTDLNEESRRVVEKELGEELVSTAEARGEVATSDAGELPADTVPPDPASEPSTSVDRTEIPSAMPAAYDGAEDDAVTEPGHEPQEEPAKEAPAELDPEEEFPDDDDADFEDDDEDEEDEDEDEDEDEEDEEEDED